ncbi:MAG: hypothetical protein JW993_04450 [Sedimentisphaerales bacterium]|nr:hypothetical protein [Sedimentisphaerales bacterium]
MKENKYPRVATALTIVALLAAISAADSTAVRAKLAQDVEIELTDVTIAEALERIGRQAGVAIELSDEAVWKLPDGRQTRLSVTLEGKLAEGLEQMLNEFFLRYAVGSESVVVYPRPELRHILGRPTPRLLRLLKNVYTNKMWLSGDARSAQFTQIVINQLAGEAVTLLPLNEFENAVHVIGNVAERGASSEKSISSTAPKTPVTLATILEETVGGRDTVVWYITAPSFPDQPAEIHIVQRLDYSKVLFGQIVDVSFQDEEGLTVLRKLTAMANIDLEIVGEDRPWVDRSWLHRRISLDVLNVTVREALNRVTRALGGQVGSVNYERGSYEVVGPVARTFEDTSFAAATHPSERAVPAGDDYVGKISIPMGGGANRYFIEFMLRERDLPEDLRRLRAEKIREIFESFTKGAEAGQ